MNEMNIVIDTNVIASGIFFGGKPKVLLDKLIKDEFTAFVTNEIIQEYKETFDYLLNKYSNNTLRIPLAQIISKTKLIESKNEIHVCRDPDDDKFISCAKAGKCLFIISGDKDLLSLKSFDEIEIVTVTEFFEKHG